MQHLMGLFQFTILVTCSHGERYLSTVLFNNLCCKDADAEDAMPLAWREQSGEKKDTTDTSNKL